MHVWYSKVIHYFLVSYFVAYLLRRHCNCQTRNGPGPSALRTFFFFFCISIIRSSKTLSWVGAFAAETETESVGGSVAWYYIRLAVYRVDRVWCLIHLPPHADLYNTIRDICRNLQSLINSTRRLLRLLDEPIDQWSSSASSIYGRPIISTVGWCPAVINYRPI